MNKHIMTVLSILFGLLLINGGLDKFFHYMPIPENLPVEVVTDGIALLEIQWLMPLIGTAELIAGLLILIPKTRLLGALIFFPVFCGIFLTHITVAPDGLPIAIIMALLLLAIFYQNKAKLLQLIK
jgi:putative oxidoreductase